MSSRQCRPIRFTGCAVATRQRSWSGVGLPETWAARGARRIGVGHDEADIPTRWDSPGEAIARLPEGATLTVCGPPMPGYELGAGASSGPGSYRHSSAR